MGNEYGRPKDIVGETRQAFTSTADTAFDVCLENVLTNPPRRMTTLQSFEQFFCFVVFFLVQW